MAILEGRFLEWSHILATAVGEERAFELAS